MSARFQDFISGITGTVPGGTSLVPVPTELRLLGMTLFVGATISSTPVAAPTAAQIAALIELITIEVDSRTIREITPAELVVMNAENQIAFVNGAIYIPFEEPKRATVRGSEALAWPLYGVRTMNVKVKWASSAVAPLLSASYVYDFERQVNSSGVDFSNIVYWVRHTVEIAGAGDKDVNYLDVSGVIQRVTLHTSTVTEVIAKVGARTVGYLNAAVNASELPPFELTPQANTFPIIFDRNQVVDDGLDTGGRPLMLKVKHSGAANYIALQQIRKNGFRA